MLKPRDIANVDFGQAWRGYNRDDVDQFVRKIVAAYEDLYQQNLRLKEQTEELKARIDEYSQTEVQIDETLALARQTAADVKAAARERGSTIVAEAKVQADDIVRRARQQVEEHLARAQELTRQEQAFRVRFRDLLEAYWALLEEERRDSEQLTQSIVAVAGQVAAAADTRPDVSGGDVVGVGTAVNEDEIEADDETYGVQRDPRASVGDSSDDLQHLQRTRRMDALRPDFDGEGSA